MKIILAILAGFSLVTCKGCTYSLRCEVFNDGKSQKVFAEELGGSDFISFNWYQTERKSYVKPCEMSLDTQCLPKIRL